MIVGLTEQDAVLALGYTPIATTEWYGDQPHAVWPWAQDELGDARPTVLDASDGFQFERIASLRPDLILGVNPGMKRADYEKLSQLAPTVAAGKGSTDCFGRADRRRARQAGAGPRARRGRLRRRGRRAPGVPRQDRDIQPERVLRRADLRLPGRASGWSTPRAGDRPAAIHRRGHAAAAATNPTFAPYDVVDVGFACD